VSGITFVVSTLYLTLAVSFVITVLERNFAPGLMGKTLLRWGKFLLLLAVLAIVIQVLTWIQESLA